MGLVKSVADNVIREIGNKSREFYEFVLPPVDMQMSEDGLVVTIDLPGFGKNDVELHLASNILSIRAQKPRVGEEEAEGTGDKDGGGGSFICSQRPNTIDKKIRLPVGIREGEERVESAKFSDGVLTVVIPLAKKRSGKDITIE